MAECQEDFRISADPTEVDHEVVWQFLSTDAYWGRWRSRATLEAQVAGAWRVVGAYALHDGRTVGFASPSTGVAASGTRWSPR